MPRSGTSLTAAIFEKQGYFLSKTEKGELRQGDEYNPLGYFEAETLIKANSRIFSRVGFNYDNTWLYEKIPPEKAKKILTLSPLHTDKKLVFEYQKTSPWLWKDPRLCYTLAYWSKLIDWDVTCVLLIKRSPADIYNSFLRLNWRRPSINSKNDVYQRVDEHIKFAEDIIKKSSIPCLTINYQDFESNPKALCLELNKYFGLQLDSSDIPYSKSYNHSGFKGKVSTALDVVANSLPLPMVKLFKSLIPLKILRWLFPERNFGS